MASLLDAIGDPLPLPQWAYAANVLKAADVPQWLALWAPRPLLWADAVGSNKRPLPPGEAAKRLAPALERYRAMAAEKWLWAAAQPPAAERVKAFLKGDVP